MVEELSRRQIEIKTPGRRKQWHRKTEQRQENERSRGGRKDRRNVAKRMTRSNLTTV